ncbi:MAG: formate/nitrite transporter family protein [Bacilli bacterium]|nr:formate/nitrite transporter family protein [Bacilli bacterium]MBR1936102.1 formate/nitrite transporter family protein [Bacilli bacterium]
MNRYELIRKSIAASLLISLGNYALLKIGNPIGPIIFAFGLLGVCYMGANLFTGKCGFLFSDKIPYMDLFIILIVNMLAGYLFGYLYSYCDSDVVLAATNKVASWNLEFPFFVKSILCGCIMYIAVYMYKKGTSLGIIYGIPLFIFCGFQHCVANVITLGVARTFHWSLLLAILGNFVGSLFVWYLFSEDNKKQKKKR